MAEHPNTIKRANTVEALNREAVESFTGEYDRFAQTIGLFGVETVAAGTALYQYKITGSLANGADSDGSSGTSYVEGDFIARSKYSLDKTPVGEVEFVPYAKQTTAQSILKGGFENAVLRTDRKALQQMRSDIVTKFFSFLANGTTVVAPEKAASGKTQVTWGLQEALAYAEAGLLDVLEANNEEGGELIHFVNRQDAYKYLAEADVTTQEMFGMTYLEQFLGVRNVMLTNKVAAGTVYATPIENIHVYGIDFATLADTGLEYASDASGLIGVSHDPSYDYASAITYFVRSANFMPEVTDFIAKGLMAPAD